MITLRIFIAAIVVTLWLVPRNAIGQAEFNVLNESPPADPSGIADSAPAFRSAYAKVVSAGGGTVRVPVGSYKFVSTDPSDPTTHLLIASKNVRLIGDFSGPPLPTTLTNKYGSTIFSSTPNIALIKVARSSQYSNIDPANIYIERLRLDRSTTALTGGNGITFSDNVGGGISEISTVVLSDLTVQRQFIGIHGHRVSASQGARVQRLQLRGSTILNNGSCGLQFDEFNEITISDCLVVANGSDGVLLNCHSAYEGTAYISTSSVHSNRGNGMSFIGSEYACQDIHLVGCQIDKNYQHGVSFQNSFNVNISGCSITSNCTQGYTLSESPPFPIFYHSGFYAYLSENIALSGTTIEFNYGIGLSLESCKRASISACNFAGNNNGNALPTIKPALRISGGEAIALSALAFGIPAKQVHGIYVTNGPKSISGVGLTFEAGSLYRITGSANSTGSGVIQYFAPEDTTTLAPVTTWKLP